jgi:asparagine synthase (glutamine-hydrolysing)
MCGIAGMVYAEPARSVDAERLLAMCRTLCHRGPDDEGTYLEGGVGLASRRLAVVDVIGARQPVHDESGAVQAVVNGEIYNYQELRRRLSRRGHRFSSAGDCEVVTHLYEEYGTAFAERLEGMFAIALWDRAERQLVLCRDRLGIKPLYYTLLADGLIFGSEIKAVLAAGVSTNIDLQALGSYLSLMYIPGPRSIYRAVHKLEAATTLVWRAGQTRSWRYWDLSATQQRGELSPVSAQSNLRALLTASVEAQLMADVPLGFFLSGGLDSSSVVAAARYARPDQRLRTFTVGFQDRSYDERAEASLVADHLETEHTALCVEPRPQDVVDRMVPLLDEPFADPSIVPTYYLCELARQYVTVALSGDGGDELFAGYHSYQADKLARYYRYLPRALTSRLAPGLLRFLPVSHRRASLDLRMRRFVDNALHDPARSHYLWRVVFREEHKATLLEPDVFAELSDAYETHAPHDHAGAAFDPLTRFQFTDANVYLVDNVLTKIDRLSMAHSLEVRVPMLSTALVEFAFSLPGRVKMPGYQTKWLLRRTMADALPSRIVSMHKRGFNAPLPRWLTDTFRPLVDEYLSADVLRRQGFFQPDEVRRWIARHMARGGEHSREIWILLMFSMWVEEHKANL